MPDNPSESKRFALSGPRRTWLGWPVTRRCLILNPWLPVFCWMTLIFLGSTDLLSSRRTSRFLEPWLRWLNPSISPVTVERIQLFTRKCGHLSEYAILAVLAWRAFRSSLRSPCQGRWVSAQCAFGLAALYAVSDEVHQSFVSTRYASGWDVLIDMAGAALGLSTVGLWLLRSRRDLLPATGGPGKVADEATSRPLDQD